jgi:hypothetical protein
VKVRLQADADLNEDIVNGVLRREPTIDCESATDASIRNLSDWEVLQVAMAEGRILVSHDRRTMPGIFGKFVEDFTSPGLFLISQSTKVLAAIESILLV